MYCMKCGRETIADNAFCQDCLMVMEKYPVQPGSVVLLPRRKESYSVKKTPRRRILSAEEQVKLLKKWLMILSVILAVAIAANVLMFNPTMHYLMDHHFEIGQNYTTVMPAVTSSPSVE